jgi:nicotinamide mononucleotide transporter
MLDLLISNIQQTTVIEYLAVVFLLAYVILATRQSPWCWPLGMIGVSLYFVISYRAQLYAEMPLQVIYFILSIYGWYAWKYGGKNHQSMAVSKIRTAQYVPLFLLTVAGTLITGFLLNRYTDTDVAYWDAATTTLSILATWMQARKKLENWVLWIITDSVYVGLFLYKQYVFVSALNLIYIGFAVYGYFAWRKTMNKAQTSN